MKNEGLPAYVRYFYEKVVFGVGMLFLMSKCLENILLEFLRLDENLNDNIIRPFKIIKNDFPQHASKIIILQQNIRIFFLHLKVFQILFPNRLTFQKPFIQRI